MAGHHLHSRLKKKIVHRLQNFQAIIAFLLAVFNSYRLAELLPLVRPACLTPNHYCTCGDPGMICRCCSCRLWLALPCCQHSLIGSCKKWTLVLNG